MKKKQAIAFLLSTTMAVGGAVQAFAAASDINGHWAEATIAKWQSVGKIGGYEDGTFKPDKTITRAEFVRLLNTATATSFTSSANISFSDVKESDWFFADVAKAVGSKITSGFEDGTFRPSETVTRAQAAVFICNAKGLAPNESAANTFADAAQIPAWAKGAVGAVVTAGYMSGYPDGSFGAGKGMTRAEAVSTLDRFFGTTTTPAPDNQGVSTPDVQDKEDTTIAEAPAQEGNMVWRSGGGGGSSRGSSSSNGGSSSSDKDDNDIVTKDTTISNQRDADKLKGKTVFGDVTINLNSDLDLENVKFKGDVKVNSGTVAAAYIGDDTAVAAASSFKWTITLVGTTSFDGNVTVTSESTSAPLVEIVTRTRKSINSFIARAAARIVGFDTVKVQASAPVKVADGKVENITAEKDAEITLEKDATITKVEVTGDAKVTVEDGASVTNVAVSGSAEAKIEVKGTANVGEVAISGSATATVDVAESAKVDKITSTSSGKTEVTGDGTISKIEATNPDTVDTTGATKAPDVEQIGGSEEKPGDGEEEKIEVKAGNVTPDDKTLTEGTEGTKTYAFTVDGVTEIKAEGIKVESITSVTGLTGAATTEGNKVTVTFTATKEVKAGTNEFTVTIPAANITADDTHKVSADVTAKVSVVVEAGTISPVQKPTISAITASGDAVKGTIVTVGESPVSVTLEAAVNADIPTDSEITWEITENNGVTNLALSKTPSTVTAGKASTTLTVPANAVTDNASKEITVTATYTPEGGTAVTKDITLTLATEAGMAKVVGSVTVNGTVDEIDITTQSLTSDLTAIVKNAAEPSAPMENETVTWELVGDYAAGTQITVDSEAAKAAITSTTNVNGEATATLKVDPNETQPKVVVKASAGTQSGTFEVAITGQQTETPATIAANPTTVTLTDDDATTENVAENERTVEFTITGATLKNAPDDLAGWVKAPETIPSGLTYTVAADTTGTDHKVAVTFTSDRKAAPVDENKTATYTLAIPVANLEAKEGFKVEPTTADGETLDSTVNVTVNKKGGSEVVTSGITGITAEDANSENIAIENDTITMTAPTTATTIDLTAALAQAEAGATVKWTIKDTNTTNVKIKDDTAEGKDTVTNILAAGSLESDGITLNIPANIDVSGGDKSVRVEVVYTGKPTSETPKAGESVPSVVATKTLTITFTKDGNQEGQPNVTLAVTGNGASTNAPVDLNSLAEDEDYEDVTLTLTAENFEATSGNVTLTLAGAGEDGTVATGTGFLNGNALEENKTTKTIAANELVPDAAGGVDGAETKDVTVKVRVAKDQANNLTVTPKIGQTAKTSTTIYVTPKTAQTVDTVSITGLADLSKHNTDGFTTLPTLVAATGDNVEYQEETPHSTGWKYYGADGNSSEVTTTAFDKPGVYKTTYNLAIKDGVNKTFKTNTEGGADVIINTDKPNDTGFEVETTGAFFATGTDQAPAPLTVTVSVTVSEAKAADSAISLTFDKDTVDNNKVSAVDGLVGVERITELSSVAVNKDSSSSSSNLKGEIGSDGTITFSVDDSASSTDPVVGGTFTVEIPAANLTLKPGYALAENAENVNVTVTVEVTPKA